MARRNPSLSEKLLFPSNVQESADLFRTGTTKTGRIIIKKLSYTCCYRLYPFEIKEKPMQLLWKKTKKIWWIYWASFLPSASRKEQKKCATLKIRNEDAYNRHFWMITCCYTPIYHQDHLYRNKFSPSPSSHFLSFIHPSLAHPHHVCDADKFTLSPRAPFYEKLFIFCIFLFINWFK